MKKFTHLFAVILVGSLITACGNSVSDKNMSEKDAHGATAEAEVAKGPRGGRLLTGGDFALELSIFETGVPPEFRAWATLKGQQLNPADVDLTINLTRLGGKVDKIQFKPHGDVLRGDSVIYEPHSFVVTINAIHNGTKYTWEYDNFEGRTKIESTVAEALEIKTSIAGPVTLQETISVFGKVVPNAERIAHVDARFPGVIRSASASIGDTVKQGQVLATIESNESLKLYSLKAPISGVITQRNANPGEQTGERQLFSITDTSTVWVDLAIFPSNRHRVKVGALVEINIPNTEQSITGNISMINVIAETNQSVTARVVINNEEGRLFPGSFIQANIRVGEHPVPLAVKRTGLQAFRDFTVVYAKIGDEYEVRMLELGRQDNEWIEVQGGLEVGTRYVSENSYVIKADIEKSGASHDH